MAMTSSKPYLLRAMFEWIVDNGCTPYIDVDATQDDVNIPREYVANGGITFNLSATAIKDLRIGNDAIEFIAKFGGAITNIFIPINAVVSIYAKENRVGMLFDATFQEEETQTREVKAEKAKASPLKIVKKPTK
jgi:stringent starvation protein B